jgi:antitoxin YefM
VGIQHKTPVSADDQKVIYNIKYCKGKKPTEMDAITTTQAKSNLDNLIDQVIANVQPTILCNDNGNKAVLISLDEFSAWQETMYLLSNPVNANRLITSIQAAEVGKVFEKSLIEE